MRNWKISGFIVAGALLCLTACSLFNEAADTYDLDGQAVHFKSLEGQWVLVSVWADWCPTCKKEIANFNQFYRQLPENTVLFGGNIEKQSLTSLKDFQAKYRIEYPILQDLPLKKLKLETLAAVPALVVIDPSGQVHPPMIGLQSIAKLNSIVHHGAQAMLISKHFWVSGKVQGVSYRASTQEKAKALGITGWVKNLPDESVELVATGSTEQIAALEDWLWQGPQAATVVGVKAEQLAEVETYSKFSIVG